MDEYVWALSLFLFHYYSDMLVAAQQVIPPQFGPLTVNAAKLCQYVCPRNHPVPSQVTDVLISQGERRE